jgi:hypothetical protein
MSPHLEPSHVFRSCDAPFVAEERLPCKPGCPVDRETCADCGKEAPQTETNYTLISAQFGWRLTRSKGPSGELVVAWRCPECWREFKKQRPGTITGNGQSDASPTIPPPGPTTPIKTTLKSSPPRRASTIPPKPSPPRPSTTPEAGKRPVVPARRRPQ